jgi:serine/threonine-protein kinase HipA
MGDMASELTLQVHIQGGWQDAATVAFKDPASGHRGGASFDYRLDYCLAHDPEISGTRRDHAAVSVCLPISMEWRAFAHWPALLLDLLPQGYGRAALTPLLGFERDSDAADLPLLLRAGGAPIGNIRVKEAWEAEQTRLSNAGYWGLNLDEVFGLSERFVALAAEFAVTASGSSGVQGAWPKLLLTQRRDGLWYPDPLVADEDAVDHVIVKWVGDKSRETRLILASEAPYLELARAFGLRCGRPLQYRGDVLLMPRFDRAVEDGQVRRLGQESLVAASGIAAFGHEAAHEDYLQVIKRVCDQPADEVTEYVLRDVLNLALGNPDNHGRNAALQKRLDGSIRLSPLYDFCPMRLDPTGIRRSTRWACMQGIGGTVSDIAPDWAVICRVAADGVMDANHLREILASKADTVSRLPALGLDLGLDPMVISQAMGRCAEIAQAIGLLA